MGLIVGWRRDNMAFLLICLVIAALFAIQPGALGQVRLKLSTMIFLYPFAGIGAHYLWDAWKHRVKRA
jgi:hypothetical protein